MANTKKTSSSKSGAARNASVRKKDAAPKSAGRTTAKQRAEEEAALEKRIRERNRIVSVVVFACALFVFFVALIEGDGPWRALHNFYLGLFGFGAYLLPILSIAVAVISSLEEKEYSIGAKSIQTAVMILLLSAFIHVIQYDGAGGYFETVLAAYQDATVTINGGFFGALIGGIFLTFGKAGAIITNVLLLFVNFMILSGFTLIQFFRSLWKPVQKTGEQILPAIENQWEERRTRTRQPEIDVPLGPPQMDDTQKLELDPQRIRMRQIVPDLGDETSVRADAPKGFADPPASQDGPKGFDDPPAAAETGGSPHPAKKEPPLEEIVKKAAGTNTRKKKDEEAVDRLFVPKEAMESRVDDYRLPPLGLLKPGRQTASRDVSGELKLNAEKLVDTLRSFGVETKITDISRGPSVTRYELKPSAGVKISKITGLADDIALNLAASGVRIEAPIPNKAAVGIEVPNKISSTVSMRELLETPEFQGAKSKLTAGLGKDITGNCVYCDVAKMPHLLIAGATGAGKSVCMNSIIVSILYKAKPEEVKFLMIDPKKVEFAMYSGIPHLLVPVVTDPRKASGALGWAVTEMLQRYKMFADNSVKDITGYNRMAEMRDDMQRMPQIVIFIDELADLMMAAPNEVEDSICRLAQMARAAGMHLVIATQRPSVDVITGIIKANIPSRIALTVSSQVDSRTILDSAGAEKLLGRGDMLYNPVGLSKPTRVQGCFVTEQEIEELIAYVKSQGESEYSEEINKEIEKQAAQEKKKGGAVPDEDGDDKDPLFEDAVKLVLDMGSASTSALQRRLKVGYARGARIVDELEQNGIVGPPEGSKPRKLLITKQQWMEIQAASGGEAEDETPPFDMDGEDSDY